MKREKKKNRLIQEREKTGPACPSVFSYLLSSREEIEAETKEEEKTYFICWTREGGSDTLIGQPSCKNATTFTSAVYTADEKENETRQQPSLVNKSTPKKLLKEIPLSFSSFCLLTQSADNQQTKRRRRRKGTEAEKKRTLCCASRASRTQEYPCETEAGTEACMNTRAKTLQELRRQQSYEHASSAARLSLHLSIYPRSTYLSASLYLSTCPSLSPLHLAILSTSLPLSQPTIDLSTSLYLSTYLSRSIYLSVLFFSLSPSIYSLALPIEPSIPVCLSINPALPIDLSVVLATERKVLVTLLRSTFSC